MGKYYMIIKLNKNEYTQSSVTSFFLLVLVIYRKFIHCISYFYLNPLFIFILLVPSVGSIFFIIVIKLSVCSPSDFE